jgi:hypothetical protein
VLNQPRNRRIANLKLGPEIGVRDDKATVRPPFDPVEFARQSELTTVPPPAGASGPDDPVVTNESTTVEVSTVEVSTVEVLFVEADTIPTLAVAREDLEWFELSPAVNELLKFIDGEASIAQVCASAKQDVDEGVVLVEQLVRDGVLSVK